MRTFKIIEVVDGKDVEVVTTSNMIAMWYENGYKYIRPEGFLKLNEKEHMDQNYKDVVYKLKEQYPEVLSHVDPEVIKFTIDTEWEPTEKSSKNSKWKIDIKKETGSNTLLTGFKYVLKLRTFWLNRWNDDQVPAAIMSQILRIDPDDFSVIKYTEDYHSKIGAVLGIDYLGENKFVKNILEEKVNFDEFKKSEQAPDAQVSIDEGFVVVEEDNNIVDVDFEKAE